MPNALLMQNGILIPLYKRPVYQWQYAYNLTIRSETEKIDYSLNMDEAFYSELMLNTLIYGQMLLDSVSTLMPRLIQSVHELLSRIFENHRDVCIKLLQNPQELRELTAMAVDHLINYNQLPIAMEWRDFYGYAKADIMEKVILDDFIKNHEPGFVHEIWYDYKHNTVPKLIELLIKDLTYNKSIENMLPYDVTPYSDMSQESKNKTIQYVSDRLTCNVQSVHVIE